MLDIIYEGYMTQNIHPLDLKPQFHMPEGWRWHSFEREGRHIRFGSVFPKDSIPDAVVVCLQGVREFSEKYFEVAQWCLEHNLAFWTCDWAGQGKSTRFLKNPQKRHSHGFDADIEDLQYFILEYIKHSSVHPDKGRIPLALLAHSMGAHTAMRYMCKYPSTFECAALSAPMIGIKAFAPYPQKLLLGVSALCKLFAGSRYVPTGNDWGKRIERARLSSDPVRENIDNLWCEHDPELQCGDVTFRWVHEAQLSCIALKKSMQKFPIETPCLFGLPGKEDLVDNDLALSVIAKMPNAKVMDYPEAYHELLMEKDEFRNNFLGYFYELVQETIIDRPETLKPF